MRKVDPSLLVIAVLAVVALVLTGVGVAKSDAWTGERSYTFMTSETPLAAQGPTTAGSSPARFEWPAPANATALQVNATISFSGQAVQGGSAVVRLTVIAPDGRSLPSTTRALSIGPGSTSASLVIDARFVWAETPDAVRDTRTPSAMTYGLPVVVLVTVDRPADLPAASYTFNASIAAMATTYSSK